jgi:endonuclease YncB( thermonuclease family)
MKKRLLFLICFLSVAISAFGQRFPVTVVGITDGDTFTVINRDKLQLKVRIIGIDAPEKKQPFGSKARQTLSELIFKKQIEIDVQYQEKWGRYAAKVYTADGKDVGLLMLQAGMAWHNVNYDKTPAYAAAEKAARTARKGLWSEAHPVAPWVYRAR